MSKLQLQEQQARDRMLVCMKAIAEAESVDRLTHQKVNDCLIERLSEQVVTLNRVL
jgi:hypothetical protein